MSTAAATGAATAAESEQTRAAGQTVLSVIDLRKSYGDVKAVDGVSFEVGRGEVFGLLGPNGAGKTTTIEMLEGLNKPDSGSATVLGIDVTRHPDQLKEKIGVQLQTAALYPELKVTELIDLFASFYQHRRPTASLSASWASTSARMR